MGIVKRDDGYNFDEEKRKSLAKLFGFDKESEPELTESQLKNLTEEILSGENISIEEKDRLNLLDILKEISIKDLKENQDEYLQKFINDNYTKQEIYRYLKNIVYYQYTKIVNSLEHFAKEHEIDTNGKPVYVSKKFTQYLEKYFWEIVVEYGIDRELNFENEDISDEELVEREIGKTRRKIEELKIQRKSIDDEISKLENEINSKIGSTITNIGGTNVIQVAPGQGLTLGLGQNDDGGFVLTDGNGVPLPNPAPGKTHIVGLGDVDQNNLLDVLNTLSGGRISGRGEPDQDFELDCDESTDSIEVITAKDFGVFDDLKPSRTTNSSLDDEHIKKIKKQSTNQLKNKLNKLSNKSEKSDLDEKEIELINNVLSNRK